MTASNVAWGVRRRSVAPKIPREAHREELSGRHTLERPEVVAVGRERSDNTSYPTSPW
jgi:hypothetical protein